MCVMMYLAYLLLFYILKMMQGLSGNNGTCDGGLVVFYIAWGRMIMGTVLALYTWYQRQQRCNAGWGLLKYLLIMGIMLASVWFVFENIIVQKCNVLLFTCIFEEAEE